MEDIILQCLKKVYEPTTHYLQCRSGSNFFRFGGIVVMRHLTVASGEPTSNPVSLVNIDNTAIKQKCQMIRVNFKSATMSYLNQTFRDYSETVLVSFNFKCSSYLSVAVGKFIPPASLFVIISFSKCLDLW